MNRAFNENLTCCNRNAYRIKFILIFLSTCRKPTYEYKIAYYEQKKWPIYKNKKIKLMR